MALATLGQICVRLGDLARAEEALHRALDVRSPIQFHETTGAVFDTLAQIHLIRGRYDAASEFLGRASDAYGAYGRQTSQWYEWSVRVLGARLALRRGALDEAVARADEILARRRAAVRRAAGDADRRRSADRRRPARRGGAAARGRGRRARSAESRRRRGANTCGCAARCTRRRGSAADAYHDFAQSATLLDLLGERYQAALSHLALGRLVAETGARSVAERHLEPGAARCSSSSAPSAISPTPRDAQALLTTVGTGEYVISPADADDAIVRRIVDAAALPDLLGRETAAALLEAAAADCAVVFVAAAGGDVRVVASAGCDARRGARAGAVGGARQRLRPRRDRRRAARPRSPRPAVRRSSPRRGRSAIRSCGGCG